MKTTRSLLRRLAAAALGAVMVLSLAACSQPQQSSSEPPQTTRQPPIDYENLVTDAYCLAFEGQYDSKYCYHIPGVQLESCADFNDRIYQDLNEILVRDVEQPRAEYGDPNLCRMVYVWSHREHIVSILVEATSNYDDGGEYRAYYLDAQTGTEVGQTELLDAFGLSQDQFDVMIRDALGAYWDALISSGSGYPDPQTDESLRQMREQTVSAENISAAIPFLTEDGRLAFLATVYVPAGGGQFVTMLDAETGAALDGLQCTQDHVYENQP